MKPRIRQGRPPTNEVIEVWMKLKDRDELIGLMTRQSMSVRALAEAARCSHGFIQALRTGRKTSCGPVLANAIAEALDVRVGYLFDVRVSSRAGRRVQHGPGTRRPKVPASRARKAQVA